MSFYFYALHAALLPIFHSTAEDTPVFTDGFSWARCSPEPKETDNEENVGRNV